MDAGGFLFLLSGFLPRPFKEVSQSHLFEILARVTHVFMRPSKGH